MPALNDNQRPAEPEDPERQQEVFRAAGIPIGVGIGVALGVALDNIAVGIAIGAAIGVALGAAMGRTRQGMAWQATRRQQRRMLLVLGLAVVGLLVGLAALLFSAAR